jgi:hypothetical protein
MQKIFLLLVLLSFSQITNAQGFKDRVVNKEWILETPKIDTANQLNFSTYSKEKIEINTMIWKFLPNGKISYDYQTSSDVEACLGVDFIDLDLNASFWKWDPVKLVLTIQLKGGYAGIDDFIMKNDYQVHFSFEENKMTAFTLYKTKQLSFKILNPDYVRP